jgi:uncharacterized protein (TIRG00374 family)
MTLAAEPKIGISNRGKRFVYWLSSLGLAAVLLYVSLRGIEWARVGQMLRTAYLPYIGFIIVLNSAALFLRSIRWRVLLSAQGHVSVGSAFFSTSAGYLANNVLPARAGEIIRTMMISTQTNLSKAYVLTTALLERVADAIALITISAIVLITVPDQPAWVANAAKPFAILGIAGLIAIATLPRLERLWFKLLTSLPLPHGIQLKCEHLLREMLSGIGSFHNTGRAVRFVALTIVVWCMDALGTVVGAQAIGLHISAPIAFLLIAALGLGSALPSTPGYVGIYQFVAVTVLTPYGFSRTDAIAYILFSQAVAYAVIAFWGVLGFSRRRDRAGRPTSLTPEVSTLGRT